MLIPYNSTKPYSLLLLLLSATAAAASDNNDILLVATPPGPAPSLGTPGGVLGTTGGVSLPTALSSRTGTSTDSFY